MIYGVSLAGECEGPRTSLGVVLLDDIESPHNLPIPQLRNLIQEQIVSCPREFAVCTKQGWPLSKSQEENLNLSNIVTEKNELLIKHKHEEPKVGVRDKQGNIVGFVHSSYNNKLKLLRAQINKQILSGVSGAEGYQFMDENSWPISIHQEGHMMIVDILIGHCVATSLNPNLKSPPFSPPRFPPFKRVKYDTQLSFRSGKDATRPMSLDVVDGRSMSSKQVLISYVRSEAAGHALRLKEQLTEHGFSVYLDVHEIQTGVDWQDALNFAVSGCEVFIPLVTRKYGETQWTNREVKLADVLGKYILPVSFLPDWPPRCLAIQFATTQFIHWLPLDKLKERSQPEGKVPYDWSSEDIKLVSEQIASRIQGLSIARIPGLMRRNTCECNYIGTSLDEYDDYDYVSVVRSCACVSEDNSMATPSDRDGKPLVMICLHPQQEQFGVEVQSVLEQEGLEVWCTTQLDRSHMEHIDSLANSQEGITYSILNQANRECSRQTSIKEDVEQTDAQSYSEGRRDSDLHNISVFQEKADEAGVVVFILSETFAQSRVCQQQVFYCEHRKRVVPVLFEDFKMPDWLTMLVGSHGLERKKDENFMEVLKQRVKSTSSSCTKMKRNFTGTFSPAMSPAFSPILDSSGSLPLIIEESNRYAAQASKLAPARFFRTFSEESNSSQSGVMRTVFFKRSDTTSSIPESASIPVSNPMQMVIVNGKPEKREVTHNEVNKESNGKQERRGITRELSTSENGESGLTQVIEEIILDTNGNAETSEVTREDVRDGADETDGNTERKMNSRPSLTTMDTLIL